ncbi:hypothetical protein YPPY89_1896, partial [Yersinia pestis PY-89]
MIFHC